MFFLGTRMITTTAMKKAPDDRVQELLRMLNWLAAPFGSQEDRLLSFGVPDVDYTLDAKGNPVPTDRVRPTPAMCRGGISRSVRT